MNFVTHTSTPPWPRRVTAAELNDAALECLYGPEHGTPTVDFEPAVPRIYRPGEEGIGQHYAYVSINGYRYDVWSYRWPAPEGYDPAAPLDPDMVPAHPAARLMEDGSYMALEFR